ncbi:hypothetical protein ABQE70_11655 [Xanthomonas campestris pv. campestris]|uniref:hypothetical protein n=1 Tax=Xanthomonas campestris TaxID=339 RepID=UPI0032E38447
MIQNDAAYLALVVNPIKVCAVYRPKFGQGAKGGGLTLEQFQALYRSDAFYSWFGLDNPLMYAAHKAAGGMTSVYRQIGIGCETLFRTILRDAFDLTDDEVRWSYDIPTTAGKTRTLHLDGRITLDTITDPKKRGRFHQWMRDCADGVGVAPNVFDSLTGAVFEVRQGYKSKDSKRQNADIANASTAYVNGYLPCASILSNQIDGDVLVRYKAAKWAVLTGVVNTNSPGASTYDFMKDIVGYDFAGFFERNRETLRDEIDKVLNALLAPETVTLETIE